MPYSATGIGTLPHLGMVNWARAAGVGLNHITHRGPDDVMMAFQQGGTLFMNAPLVDPSQRPAPHRRHVGRTAARVPGHADDARGRLSHRAVHLARVVRARGDADPVIARFEAACECTVRAPALIQGHERIQTPVVYLGGRKLGAREIGGAVARGVEAMRRVSSENNLRQAG